MSRIRREEVLRYLRYSGQNMTASLENMIDECIEQCEALCRLRYTSKIFDIKGTDEDGVALCCGGLALKGQSIVGNLYGAQACVIMAATAGIEIDEKINYLQKCDMARAVVMDACASEIIETFVNEAQREIEEKIVPKNLGERFSPGYGVFPRYIQHELLACLSADKVIGLYCNDSFALIPRKSITAVIGIFNEYCGSMREKCEKCFGFGTCPYKKAGKS